MTGRTTKGGMRKRETRMDDWHTKPRNREVDDAPFGEEEREKEKEGEWKQKAKRREEKRERTRSKIRKEKKKEVESG